MAMTITLQEYNRRWDLVMAAFADGRLSAAEASAAVHDLTALRIQHTGRRVA